MKGKIIITTDSGNNASLFLENRNLIMNNAFSESIVEKIQMVIEKYKYYRTIAENLRSYHSKLRSKSIYREKLQELLSFNIN